MKTSYILVSGIGIILLIAGFMTLPNIGNQDLHRFELTSDSETLPIPDRLCFAKVSNIATVGGELFDADQSPFFASNPELEFFAGDAVNIIDGFQIEPKLTCLSFSNAGKTTEQLQADVDACIVDKDGENCHPSNHDVMVIKSSELTLKVISEDNVKNEKITTYIDTITTDRVEVADGTEVKLAKYIVKVTDLEDDLSGGTYSSIQEFRVFGTLILHPKICSACEFVYTIPEEAIPTFHEIIVKKAEGEAKTIDSDGDGVADTNESGKQNDAVAKDVENQNAKTKSAKEAIESATEFGDCLIIGDTDCLNQGKFAMIWFAVAGIIGIGIFGFIISLLTRNRNG
ncbi:MAG: hypothetical protein K5790_10180 [Nitrosopumilus sp.]|uniref:hypothetical protein n=1 Tax=Nitrosopumilus sp. TaxID=2024843 RepID=UPI00247C4188|nr:hypothetical protein [Nitrosopumilus sp.]MCV0393636.1 hypothetical protein [Nitrosopumilus sp.]